MMPTYRIHGQYLQGNAFEYWTQDPAGLAATLREQGHFVSHDVRREDAPVVVTPPRCRCAGRVACQWVARGAQQVSVCVRCGGDR
jgi:hypothetical protein